MIEDILPRYQETANGTKKSFTLPFDIIDSRYIMVYTNQTKQTSGFSISGQELVFDSAPVVGTVITVVRAIPIDWEDYSYGALNLDNIVTLIIAKMQTLEEQVSRSLKVNIYDDSTQTVEFFLQQLADAQSVLESAQDKLNMITSTSNSAIANIKSAKEEAVQTVLKQASIAESAMDSAANSANKAQTILDSVETTRDDAINTFNENATSKTSEYDSNASAKLSTFNSNADSRTTIFNTNAQTKMDSIDASVKSAAGSASAAAASAEKAASFAVDIAQNLDSPSANTIPSTQAVANESSRLTSIMANDYIPYTSTKNFIKVINVTKGTAPTTNQYNDIIFNDKNGNIIGAVGCSVNTSGVIETYLRAFKNIAGDNNAGTLSIMSNMQGNFWSYVNSSNADNSIVTTVAHGSNYVKLGNGLILQWGIIATNQDTSGANYATIALSTPFSDTKYRIFTSVTAMESDFVGGVARNTVTALKTTTSFKISYNISAAIEWFAIGW